MNIHKHLCITYDNYRCNFCNHSFYGNSRVSQEAQLKKKDNRPHIPKSAVIF